MIDTLFGWYIREYLKGKFITINFEQSLAIDATGTFSMTDAVDGAVLKAKLDTDNFILLDVFAYADPGIVSVNVLPDNDNNKKFRINCHKYSTRTPIMPPKMAEVDLIIDYTNESQPNNIVISFSAMQIPQDYLDEFTILSEQIPVMLQRYDISLSNILKTLINIQDILQQKQPTYSVIPQQEQKIETKNFCKRR